MTYSQNRNKKLGRINRREVYNHSENLRRLSDKMKEWLTDMELESHEKLSKAYRELEGVRKTLANLDIEMD